MHEAAFDSVIAGYGNKHTNVATCYINIGNVYSAQGNYNEALVQHQKGLEVQISVFGCEHQEVTVAILYNNIGDVYSAQDNYENALLQYQKSLEIDIRVFGCDSADVANSYNSIRAVHKQQGA